MNHINVRFQNILQSVLDRAQCEQRNARGFEFQQKIHVAVWAVRAIGIGTEQFCFLDRLFLRSELHTVFDFLNIQHGTNSVSYTHLDVYKRQLLARICGLSRDLRFDELRKVLELSLIHI